ncbi:MAG: hypothetical protein VX259_13560, partial [Pseudomonadota bacterium]|nr:hypothetical protein [Pseudomonadota bacterium]
MGSTRYGSATAAGVEYSIADTSLRVGMVNERGSFFGAPAQGSFRFGDVNTVVFDAAHSFWLGSGWSLDAYGSLGLTRLGAGGNSLFTGGQMLSSRYGVSFSGPISATERLSFGLAQPLTIEGGSLKLGVGTGYDLDRRALVMGERSAEARSPYRSMMFTGGYAKAWDAKSLRLGFAYDA